MDKVGSTAVILVCPNQCHEVQVKKKQRMKMGLQSNLSCHDFRRTRVAPALRAVNPKGTLGPQSAGDSSERLISRRTRFVKQGRREFSNQEKKPAMEATCGRRIP